MKIFSLRNINKGKKQVIKQHIITLLFILSTTIITLLILINWSISIIEGNTANLSEGKSLEINWNFENEAKRVAAMEVPPDISRYTADKGEETLDLIGAIFGPPNYFTQGSGGKGTFAAHADYWHYGSGTKYWQVTISTKGYKNLKLSSKQRGSKTGPRDFKVQYSTDGTSWIDIPGAKITVSEKFTTGSLKEVILPKSCENQPKLYLRWIMVSNKSIEGGVVGEKGTNRIDDILITGDKIS